MTAKTTTTATTKTGIAATIAWLEHWPIACIMVAIGLFAVGCKLVSGTEAPTSVEHAFYDVQTNYINVPKVVLSTNIVTETNTVQVIQTNTVGQVVVATQTNFVPSYVITPITNLVQVPVYAMTQNANAQAAAATVATVGNGIVPGAGSLAGSGVTMLLGLWGWLRSYKGGQAGIQVAQQSTAALAQEMETVLEFVNTLPNGSAYTTAITGWLQSHQVQTGTATAILETIGSKVSNPNAKVAVQDILTTLQTMGTPLPGATTATAAAPAAAAPAS